MKELLKNIVGSFNNSPDGASGKKLTAFVCTLLCIVVPIDSWVIWAWLHNDFSLLTTVITVMTSFILVLFGLNEYGKKNNNEPKDESNA